MAVVEKSVLIECPAAQMFELVDAVEDYPKFLPWCGGSEVIERTPEKTVAQVHIHYRGVKSQFSTENTKVFPTLMEMKLIDGPFSHLEGTWRFKPLGDQACKVEFCLHYEFSSKLLEKVVGPVFNHIANTFIEAFVQQAQSIKMAS